MSHPDPLFDPENSYEDDEMDHEDFYYDEDISADDVENMWDEDYDDSMDGDHDSAMTSCGWGTDEDYGYFGEDDSETFCGEDY